MPTSAVAKSVSLAVNHPKPETQDTKTLSTSRNTQETKWRAKTLATSRKTQDTKALQLAGLGGLCGSVDSQADAVP